MRFFASLSLILLLSSCSDELKTRKSLKTTAPVTLILPVHLPSRPGRACDSRQSIAASVWPTLPSAKAAKSRSLAGGINYASASRQEAKIYTWSAAISLKLCTKKTGTEQQSRRRHYHPFSRKRSWQAFLDSPKKALKQQPEGSKPSRSPAQTYQRHFLAEFHAVLDPVWRVVLRNPRLTQPKFPCFVRHEDHKQVCRRKKATATFRLFGTPNLNHQYVAGRWKVVMWTRPHAVRLPAISVLRLDTKASICLCISDIFSRIFRMISTPARFTPKSRVSRDPPNVRNRPAVGCWQSGYCRRSGISRPAANS